MSRPRLALAALVAAALLSACQDDDPEPNVADPTPSPTSSEPTPSPTTVTSPVAEPRSPEDTVRAWVDDWNQALASGDTTQVRSHEAETCRGCDELVEPLEEIAQAGGRFQGGAWEVVGLKAVDADDSSASVNLAVDVAAGATTPSQDATPTPYPATKHLLKFKLERSAGIWQVSVIELLS